MSEKNINWDEQLQANEWYVKAKEAGIALDDVKASSKEDYERQIEELKKQLSNTATSPEPQAQGGKVANGTENAQDKPAEKAANGAEGNTRQTMEINGEKQPAPQNDLQWIEEKRKFWKEFAESQENNFQNDPQKDLENKTFSCTLNKESYAGTITYSSPTSAQITKDSHLTMYQGLVKDALKNNLSITFGASLDDKQKAMLLAACLLEKGTYANGDKMQMVNPPKIDINAEYFKALPEDAKTVLNDYAQKQALAEKAEQARAKMDDLRKRLKANNERLEKGDKAYTAVDENGNPTKNAAVTYVPLTKKEKEEAMQERQAMRSEQINLMKEQAALNPAVHIDDKNRETVEKIIAARMGIIHDENVTDVNGKPITENKTYTEKKQQQNPGLMAYLKQKYGENSGGK